MQILIALVVGASIGLAVHFLAKARATRGPMLAPIIGAFAAGLVWMILTWAGIGTDSVWLWLSPFVVSWIAWPIVALIGRSRLAHDERERKRLRIA